MSTWSRRTALVALTTALLVPLLAVPAAAHVTATPNEANSPYFRTALRVPHGCDGTATTTVRVQIPDGVDSAKPEVVPGWDIEIVPAEESADEEEGHGSGAAVAEIVWSGGNLPDNQFQEFGLSFRITDEAPEVLWFPTVQECEEGEHRWIEIPSTLDGWGDLDEPAPYVVNNVGGGNGHGADDGAAAADDAADSGAVDGVSTGEDSAGGDVAASEDSGSGALPVIALIAGLLGLAAGVGALTVSLRAARR